MIFCIKVEASLLVLLLDCSNLSLIIAESRDSLPLNSSSTVPNSKEIKEISFWGESKMSLISSNWESGKRVFNFSDLSIALTK